MKVKYILIAALFALASCGSSENVASWGEGAKGDDTAQQNTISKAASASRELNRFGFDLFQQIEKDAAGNRVLSPYSVYPAMSMVFAAAQKDTGKEMANALFGLKTEGHIRGLSDGMRNFHEGVAALGDRFKAWPLEDEQGTSLVNRLYLQDSYDQRLSNDMRGLMEDIYGAGLSVEDFASDPEAVRTKINDFVEQQTRDLITELLPGGSIKPLTRLVILNALFVNLPWLNPMNLAGNLGFYHSSNVETTVPYVPAMQTSTFNYAAINGGPTLFELPYKIDDLSMVILVPADTQDGDYRAALDEMVGKMGPNLQQWVSQLQPTTGKLLKMPMFDVETNPAKSKINDALGKVGIVEAFDANRADLYGMFTGGECDICARPYISDVFHRATIKVNERRTIGAAATAVVVTERGMLPQQPDYMVDRPFAFVLRDNKTDAVIFVGTIEMPIKSAE